MRCLTPITKRLTALLSIGLILMGVVVSGNAMAAHVNGVANEVAAPCHHAMGNNNLDISNKSNFAFDLCRQLCLNKIPDTAISAIPVDLHSPTRLSTQAVFLGLELATLLPQHRVLNTSAPPDRPHRSPHLAQQRLRI